MEISVLQSLIDRTSNEIAEYEACVQIYKDSYRLCTSDFEVEQNKYAIEYYKQRIPKLVKIQKALKKEIAVRIRLYRGIRQMAMIRKEACE